MSSRRSKRGDEDDSNAAEEREQRKREREDRRKQRDDDGNKADAERQQARDERRKKRESGEDTGSSRTRRPEKDEEEQGKKEEAEKKKREQEERQRQEKQKEEKEEAAPSKAAPSKAADKTDGPQTAFDKINDDRKRRIIDSLIDTLYELAEQKEAKSKPPPSAASSGSSTADVSALDLKVRSLRTRLRNAENATSTLAQQQKDVEVKIKLNHQEIERLKKEYASAEEEYNEAVKNGGVPAEAPKRGRGAGGGKSSAFFDVVKKAQSSLWEDKFRAFKEKQKGTATNQPQWVNNLKKSDSHIIGTTVMKREDPEKKKEKAAWQNQPKLHKAVIDPRAKKEVEPTGAKKPAWSGVSLKKAENK